MKIENIKSVRALAVVLILNSLALHGAMAKDLGVQAKVWPIAERDIREVMMAQLAESNWQQRVDKTKTAAEGYVDNLPKNNFPEAQETKTKYLDMSVTIGSDIKIPVKGPTGYIWQTMYRKGTRINPLDHLRPMVALFFFDARSKEQVAIAKALTSDIHNRALPVEVSGEHYTDTLKAFGRMVYYCTPAELNKFNVTETPALVYPGAGKYSEYMANTVFAKPYSLQAIKDYWPNSSQAVKK